MKTFFIETLKTPFQNKRLFVGGVVAYLVLVAFLNSVDTTLQWFEQREYDAMVRDINARPASDWIEYTGIEGEQPTFKKTEPISMVSYITKKRSALITWNDILYCDKLNTGDFTRIDSYSDSRFIEVTEPTSYISHWVFGDVSLQRPHDPVVSCHILSEQTICPAEGISDENISCKRQFVKSKPFELTNP